MPTAKIGRVLFHAFDANSIISMQPRLALMLQHRHNNNYCNSFVPKDNFSLFIGSVWIFKMRHCDSIESAYYRHTCYTFESSYPDNYCNRLLYNFAFYDLVAKWSLIALILVLGCCCICCLAFCTKNDAENNEQTSNDPPTYEETTGTR